MKNQNTQHFLRAIWSLRGTAAPKILSFLKQKKNGARWTDIENELKKAAISSSTSHNSLERLVKEGLISKEGKKYWATADGLWALSTYENFSSGPTFMGLPKFIQNLVAANDFPNLLPVQAEFLKKHLNSKANIIVFASPSAGKTFMAECLMLKTLRSHGKVAYLTPYRALNRQKYELFWSVFGGRFGYNVKRVDGDTPTRLNLLDKADVVVSTYERAMGGVLRHEKWIANAQLIVADELAILADERGKNLDLLLTQLKSSSRLLALSSHVGRPDVVAEWLKAKIFIPEPQEIGREYIAKSIDNKTSIEDKQGTESLTYDGSALLSILQHLKPHPDETILVLAGTKMKAQGHAAEAAKILEKNCQVLADELALACDERTPLVSNLLNCLAKGSAFHHAGLTQEVRRKVEDFLNERKLRIVASTPTLSYGVDFPIDSAIIFLDSFEFRKESADGERPGLKMLEYVQYKGRATRLFKSKRGRIYVVSDTLPQRSIETIRRNFLSAGVEPLDPPTLKDDEMIDLIVFLHIVGSRTRKISLQRLSHDSFEFISSLLAYRMLPSNQRRTHIWLAKIEESVRRLGRTPLVKVRGRYVSSSKLARKVSNFSWVPRDASYVINSLKLVKETMSEEEVRKQLLFLACSIGFVKNTDQRSVRQFVRAFREYFETSGRKVSISLRQMEIQAKMWILDDWINEKSLTEITSRLKYVDDAEIPQLGHFAAIEMQKVADLAEHLKLKRISSIANVMAERLRHGVQGDLIADPDVSLLRLDSIARRKARILFNHEYRSLLDILKQLFKSDDHAFVTNCGLEAEEAKQILAELKTRLKRDVRLRKRAIGL